MLPRNPFQRHLRTKVIALILTILVLGVGVLMILNIRREAEVLVSLNEETVRLLAGSIMRTIQNGMLGGRPDIIRGLIQDLKAELKDVRRLEVYRRNGVEAFTDLETVDQVNRRAGLDAEIIERISRMRREPGARSTNPLIARAIERIEPQEIDEQVDGAHVLTLFRPLRNLEKCQECHGSDHQVRGVLRISLGLERLDAELKAARNRQILVAIVTILGVTGALVIFMGRVVLQPIASAAEAARRIGGGDFGARVTVPNRDEIGDLGQAINDMAEHLQRMRNDLEARNTDLAVALQSLRDSMQKVELLEQLKGELVKFVPESVTRLLERNPDARELEKRESDVSVLFLDVESYTRLAEQLPPQRLNRLIQDYFSRFLEIIRGNHGEVNQEVGDGLMVIFQSEGDRTRHALNAASSALQIHAKLAELNREYQGVYPSIAIHVGINSGQALVGATKLDTAGGGRWTFTASGSTTNLAARIAAVAKGGEIMLGAETAERVRANYVLEDAGEHRLKNVSEPVRIFRLVLPGMYAKVIA